MADNLTTPYGIVATRDEAGVHHQRVLLHAGVVGGAGSPMLLLGSTVNGLLVDVTRIAGVVAVSGPLTDAQLRATPLPISKPRVSLAASLPAFATVGVASAPILAANAARKGLILVNTSATNWISIAFGATAVLYAGISLAPHGSFEMSEFTFTTAEVRAIASAAGSNLAIQEFA